MNYLFTMIINLIKFIIYNSYNKYFDDYFSWIVKYSTPQNGYEVIVLIFLPLPLIVLGLILYYLRGMITTNSEKMKWAIGYAFYMSVVFFLAAVIEVLPADMMKVFFLDLRPRDYIRMEMIEGITLFVMLGAPWLFVALGWSWGILEKALRWVSEHAILTRIFYFITSWGFVILVAMTVLNSFGYHPHIPQQVSEHLPTSLDGLLHHGTKVFHHYIHDDHYEKKINLPERYYVYKDLGLIKNESS